MPVTILIYKMLACVCLSTLIFQQWGVHLGSMRYCWKGLSKGILYSEFHAFSRTPSRNFTQFSHNFGYLSKFWGNFNIFGIKMHVLELNNSMVILSHTFTTPSCKFMQFSCNFSYFRDFWANFTMLGIKMYVLDLRN